MLKPLEYLYFIAALVVLYGELTQNELVGFFSKPLLMIFLLAWYVQSLNGKWNKMHKLMAGAFIFSWTGDVTLMFVPKNAGDTALMGIAKNPNYFLAGLAGFLITHVLYSVAFNEVSDKKAEALLPKKFWVIIPLFIYMVALLAIIVPGITGNELTRPFLAPVLVYTTVISFMVVFSVNRYKRVNDQSFALVFGGALVFMLSDSLIAVSKFVHPVPQSGFLIMATYMAGQYFIAKGCIAQFKLSPGS